MTAFTSLFCPDAAHDELASLVDIQLTSAIPENVVAIRQAIDHLDVRDDYLPLVKTPTLVIHARNESLNPVAQGRLIAASIPGAEFLEADSNNHIPLPSDPTFQTIVNAQLEFIDRQAP
jgi:pimeloyl-ACP methyl ester carboxylesterase